jgi:hypothetical protein
MNRYEEETFLEWLPGMSTALEWRPGMSHAEVRAWNDARAEDTKRREAWIARRQAAGLPTVRKSEAEMTREAEAKAKDRWIAEKHPRHHWYSGHANEAVGLIVMIVLIAANLLYWIALGQGWLST